ncbi:MAG: YqgE/AlgH family protein [Bacteroidales bacterium]|nr:YqgE/AlgH family protein [Bacteroidales bacterium]MCF8456360.1 YqgE/AlgH family protein [Bacteroidales bacterium]
MLEEIFTIRNQILPSKGRVLIAEPFLNDYYFKRSIVLLTEHNLDGSIGFVINNPVKVKLTELLPDFPDFNANVSVGGPVSTDTVQFIHTLGPAIAHSMEIKPGLYWGGDFEQMGSLIRMGKVKPEDVLFCIGYSGWSPNQLDDELSQNSWIVTELNTDKIMRSTRNIWKHTLLDMGEKYKVWANFPENPDSN